MGALPGNAGMVRRGYAAEIRNIDFEVIDIIHIAGYAACGGEIATSKKTEPLDWVMN